MKFELAAQPWLVIERTGFSEKEIIDVAVKKRYSRKVIDEIKASNISAERLALSVARVYLIEPAMVQVSRRYTVYCLGDFSELTLFCCRST